MLKWWVACLSLLATPALAQRMGGGMGGGAPPPRQTPMTPEEASRAATAKQWADTIEKARANVPPPPVPQIRFPAENEKLFHRLRMVEDQHKELLQYLDRLWKDAKEPQTQKVALDGLWRDAEKTKFTPPRWVRPAIEEYYKQHSKGLVLHPPDEQPAPAAPVEAKAPAPVEAKAPAPAEAKAPAPAKPVSDPAK
jgi:hypothetical protein